MNCRTDRTLAGCMAVLLLLCTQQSTAFDGIRLTPLGGAESVNAAPVATGTLVEASDEVLMFDCGAGSLGRLRDARFLLGELTAVFLTSLDAAHVDGCGEVLTAWLRAGTERPLPVWGPAGTIEAARAWLADSSADAGAGIEVHEVGENLIYDTEEVRVTAIVTESPSHLPSYGYRVDRNRRAVVLLGGARYSDNVAHAASGAQVVASDVAAVAERNAGEAGAQAILTSHATPEDAGRIWHAARAYLGLYSSVLLYGVEVDEVIAKTHRYFRGPVHIARSRMVIEIQNEVQIRSTPSEGPRQ